MVNVVLQRNAPKAGIPLPRVRLANVEAAPVPHLRKQLVEAEAAPLRAGEAQWKSRERLSSAPSSGL